MFIPIEQAAWPAEGEVRDLRVSLNAPVLLGAGDGAHPTRAALGWLPAGPGASVRLWLRADGAPRAVRAFDLPECPLGPSARARALERAERFLVGLGFLFPEIQPPRRLRPPARGHGAGVPDPDREERVAERGRPSAEATGRLRTPDPDPEARDACGSADATASAVRAGVRFHRTHRPGPPAVPAAGALRPEGPTRPTGGNDR